jgi:hypothetical protein
LYVVTDRGRGEPPGFLAVLSMRGALKEAAEDESFGQRIADAETDFWRVVRDALAVVREYPAAVSGSDD